MNSVIHVGPVLLKLAWVSLIVSGLIGYSIMKSRVKRVVGMQQPSTLTMLSNMLISDLFIWKLSYFLFNPLAVIHNPLTLLYFNGGDRGILIACLFSAIFLFYQSKKQDQPISFYIDLVAVGYMAFMASFSIIESLDSGWGIPLVVIYVQFVVHLMFLAWILLRTNPIHHYVKWNSIISWYSILQIFLGFLNPNSVRFLLGFSLTQIIFICIAFLSLVNGNLKRK